MRNMNEYCGVSCIILFVQSALTISLAWYFLHACNFIIYCKIQREKSVWTLEAKSLFNDDDCVLETVLPCISMAALVLFGLTACLTEQSKSRACQSMSTELYFTEIPQKANKLIKENHVNSLLYTSDGKGDICIVNICFSHESTDL